MNRPHLESLVSQNRIASRCMRDRANVSSRSTNAQEAVSTGYEDSDWVNGSIRLSSESQESEYVSRGSKLASSLCASASEILVSFFSRS